MVGVGHFCVMGQSPSPRRSELTLVGAARIGLKWWTDAQLVSKCWLVLEGKVPQAPAVEWVPHYPRLKSWE